MYVIGILFGLLAIVSLILPWINRDQINELRQKIERLQAEINRLKNEGVKTAAPARPVAEQTMPTSTKPVPDVSITPQETPKKDKLDEGIIWKETLKPSAPVAQTQEATQPRTFEQQFGGQAFVWLGGIALALAGFFMVKYSIESGMLTENVRVILGLVFGSALLYGSHIVRQHPRIADGTRISQALAGAGIADLYGCLFAATTIYHLVPSWLGFGGMMAVTALTLVMSLRYGAPIAALGLIGGFATPMMVHGEPNAPLLFGYLYLVFGSLAVVIRRQHWWWLSIPATLVAFVWVILWVSQGLAGVDGVWLSLFLLGISATVVAATRDTSDRDDVFSLPSCFRYTALGGSILLMATVTYQANFAGFEWAMFGLLSVGAILLAWFDNRTYGFAPWLAMGANAVMLLGWHNVDPATLVVIMTVFGLLFTSSSYLLMSRSKNPVSWAGLSAASALIYYLLAHYRLDAVLTITLVGHWLSADDLWAVLGFVFAALFTSATSRLFVTQSDKGQRHKMQAIFAVAATSFLSLGFAILLHQEFLAFAIAGQILAISWINRQVDIPALRYIAQALTAVFGILLLPELFALLAVPFDDFSGYGAGRLEKLHTIPSLLFQFGLPSLMLGVSSWLLRDERDDEFIMVLEFASITLYSIMCYNLIGTVFTGHETAYVARGIFTDVLLLLSFGTLRTGRQYSRPAVECGGLVLGGLALARIAGFDLLFYNPLWSHQIIGELPILNGLMLAYGLPTLLIVAIKNELTALGRADLARASKVAAYVLAFVFVSLNVRQFYHGAYLNGGIITSAEVYTYSAAWLALGVGLLFAGVMRRDSIMRMASLLIMLLTVGKVFLYDASELTGLWRVLSFFGLGMSLLGLSWFYSRFVFNAKRKE